MSVNHYDLELENLEERATGRLLMADVFDAVAFETLYGHIAGKAPDLREASAISKQILGALRRAIEAIRTRAEYLAPARDNLRIADRFEMLLDLLIYGECPEDREPGSARII